MSSENLKLSIFDIDRTYGLNEAAYKQIYLELGEYIGNQVATAAQANYGMTKIDLQKVNNITEPLNQKWIEEISKAKYITNEWSQTEIDEDVNIKVLPYLSEIALNNQYIEKLTKEIGEIRYEVLSSYLEIDNDKPKSDSNSPSIENSDDQKLDTKIYEEINRHFNIFKTILPKMGHVINIRPAYPRESFMTKAKNLIGYIESYKKSYFINNLLSAIETNTMTGEQKEIFRSYFRKERELINILQNNKNRFFEIERNIDNYYEELNNKINKIKEKENLILKYKNQNLKNQNKIDQIKVETTEGYKYKKYFYNPYYSINLIETEITDQEGNVTWNVELNLIPKGVFLCWTNFAKEKGVDKIINLFNNIGYTSTDTDTEGKTITTTITIYSEKVLTKEDYNGDFDGYKKWVEKKLNETQLQEIKNSISKYNESLEVKL